MTTTSPRPRFLRPLLVSGCLTLFACGMPGSTPASTGLDSSTGLLSVKLVDAPAENLANLFVTLRDVVAVLPDGGRVTIANGPVTVDLLELQHGAFLSLGMAPVPVGRVEQLRLMVDPAGPNEVVFLDGGTAPLRTPSGVESGLKLNGPFEVEACQTTTITIDFDGLRSVHVTMAGNSGLYLLRPVIFVKDVERSGLPCPISGGGPP